MSLLFVSFLAGILTILAPCVLPLLPIILGGTAEKNKSYPYIVIGSLGVSIFLFTLLLKATSLLINIPPQTWTSISGLILIFFGLISVFPTIWDNINKKLRLSSSSDKLMDQADKKQGILQPIILGAALGPVFSSCSFTYALLLATVLPANFLFGIANMIAYILGLTLVMLLVTVLGSKLVKRLRFASDPKGIFKRVLGVIFLIVGLLIITGNDKVFQAYVAEKFNYSITDVEKNVLETNNITSKSQNFDLTSKGKPATELTGLTNWINSDPKTLASLKGKVVLIDFWTYSCINCIRTQPYLNSWYDKYQDKNFVILGIHTPEFSFEKKGENVEKAVKDAKIKYPVALDNDYSTWNAFGNQFWPAKYLIDKEGNIRYTHFGEGNYDETESAIQQLIGETGLKVDTTKTTIDTTTSSFNALTPETYLGWARGSSFVDKDKIEYNKPADYTLKTDLKTDQFSLGGNWQIDNEKITSKKEGNKLRLQYKAKNVYLVMGSQNKLNVKITADDKSKLGSDVKNGEIEVQDYRLYKLVENTDYNSNGYIELEIPEGVDVNVFTFG